MTDGAVQTLRSVNPARPDEIVAEVAVLSTNETDSVLDRSRGAAKEWAAAGPRRVAALGSFAAALEQREDSLADLIMREVGKPLAEARGEVARAASILRYFAQRALDPEAVTYPSPDGASELVARRTPLGTVLLVCPWNFPLAIPIWKAAPALAFGNSVLLKPAGPAIGVASVIAECATESLPSGVLEVTFVRGCDLGPLLDDERVDGVSFTGSTEVGHDLIARSAGRGVPVQAEMGGHNAAVVLDDADVARAADAIVAGATGYAGQKCTATRRVVTVPDVHQSLIEAICSRWGELGVGDPAKDSNQVGPLIDARAVEDFEAAVTAGLDQGGTLLARTEVSAGDGHFVSPVFIGLDDPQATVNQEETFGPLLTVLAAADTADAVRIANSTRFGLVAAVHGRDLNRAATVAKELDCGMQRVNTPTTGVDFYAPFGGAGVSSYGPREQGEAAREFFTEWRTITVAPVE